MVLEGVAEIGSATGIVDDGREVLSRDAHVVGVEHAVGTVGGGADIVEPSARGECLFEQIEAIAVAPGADREWIVLIDPARSERVADGHDLDRAHVGIGREIDHEGIALAGEGYFRLAGRCACGGMADRGVARASRRGVVH